MFAGFHIQQFGNYGVEGSIGHGKIMCHSGSVPGPESRRMTIQNVFSIPQRNFRVPAGGIIQ